MGTRYIITVQCPECGKMNEDVYYAPTCSITMFACDCGYVVNLEEYTGIGYSEASNKVEIEAIIAEIEKGSMTNETLFGYPIIETEMPEAKEVANIRFGLSLVPPLPITAQSRLRMWWRVIKSLIR